MPMRTSVPTFPLMVLIAVLWVGSCPAQDKDVERRVRGLLATINQGDTGGELLKAAEAAEKELVKIGEPAVPQLIKTVLTHPPGTDMVGGVAEKILREIGKPALPALRAKWTDLTDEQRWLFMGVFEKHDCEWVREYAWNCLSSKGPARPLAWQFMLRTKDKRAEEVYFEALTTGGEEPEHIRWQLIPGDTPVYDEKRENKFLLAMLDQDSWVAQGKGNPPPPGGVPPWWPDGRSVVIRPLGKRKVKEAGPALLKVLQEKGEGSGYLAADIIPALVELEYTKAIPELEKIAAHQHKSTKPTDSHPHTSGSCETIRKLADDAVKRLNEWKR